MKSKNRLKYIQIKNIAIQKGGRCLSKEYINCTSKLVFQCSEGHIWSTLPAIIKNGSWCPKCSIQKGIDARYNDEYKKRILNKIHQIAIQKGGRCLTNKYVSSVSKLVFQCGKGHIWKAVRSHIKKHWCPVCANHVKPNDKEYQKKALIRIQRFVEKYGGKCLSDKYINSETKMLFQCKNGHQWETKPILVTSCSHWCPHCSKGTGESLCRTAFEQLFTEDFPSTRPEWLNGLELDGYSEKLNLAFEHQGHQHYKYIPFFHKSIEDFEYRKELDERKKEICEKRGVNLICIPEVPNLIKIKNIKKFIKRECIKLDVSLPDNFDDVKIDWSLALDREDRRKEMLQKLKDIAALKKGEILTNEYLTYNTKFKCRCVLKHEWETSYAGLIKGVWCSECAEIEKRMIVLPHHTPILPDPLNLPYEDIFGDCSAHPCSDNEEWVI